VHAVLSHLKTCEPIGVASRNLRECLLLQARTLHPERPLLARLIEEHLEDLETRNHSAIARSLRLKPPELRDLLDLLATLEPRPGRRHAGERARYITPDVYVHKLGDDYVVTVNEDGLPRLRISSFYRQALSSSHGKEARDYLNEKMRSAVWLIRSIQQRQSTILRVTESIMRFQRDFLDHGVARLRPLVLREVAEDVRLHESTVSRVTTAKYVHTPQGIFELKFFFNSRLHGQTGDDLGSEAVKFAIARLIEKENRRSPLSDQEIAEVLGGLWDRGRLLSRLEASEAEVGALRQAQPVEIARRTVAKYREAMGIASSSRRRPPL
jgi:RNA polymerase sigma-54 factor